MAISVPDPARASSWLLLTSRGQWAKFQQLGQWAFHEPSAAPASKIQPGDRAYVYLTQGKGGAEPSAIAGSIEITGPMQKSDRRTVFDAFYPHRLPFRREVLLPNPVPFANLVAGLDFLTNKAKWSIHLRGKSVRRLSSHDAAALQHAMKGVGHEVTQE